MNAEIGELRRRLRALEDEVEEKIARRLPSLRNPDGTIDFGDAIRRRHRLLRTRLHRYVLGARALVLITAPLIYMVAVPLLLLDVFASLYQAACFPVYGIDKVRRSDHFVFDRAQLGYLNLFERINCAYCSYANGLIAYVREIAGRTEQYWCPIKHARRMRDAHEHYPDFFEYGDADAYRNDLAALRVKLAKIPPGPGL
jgi:hypothetical protein